MCKSLLSACLFVVPVVAHADFTVEVDGNLGFGTLTYDSDLGDSDYDIETAAFAARAYLGRVNSDNYPFREAGFLSKKSSISLKRSTYQEEDTPKDIERNITELSARVVLPNPNFILGAGVVRGDYNPSFGNNLDRDGYSVQLGAYVSDWGAFWIEHREAEIEFASPFDETETSFVFKQINKIGRVGHLVWMVKAGKSEELSIIGQSDKRSVGGNVKWYFNQKFGVGGGLQLDFYDAQILGDAVGAVFMPEISYDFNENIGLFANLRSEAIIPDDSPTDLEVSNVLSVFGVTARF